MGLASEEQGGFRRGRGCRDQALTLMLLRQVKACTRRGLVGMLNPLKIAYRSLTC